MWLADSTDVDLVSTHSRQNTVIPMVERTVTIYLARNDRGDLAFRAPRLGICPKFQVSTLPPTNHLTLRAIHSTRIILVFTPKQRHDTISL